MARKAGGARSGDISGGRGAQVRAEKIQFYREVRDDYAELYPPETDERFEFVSRLWVRPLEMLERGEAVVMAGWEVELGDRALPGVDMYGMYRLTAAPDNRVVEVVTNPACVGRDRAPGCTLDHEHYVEVTD